MKRWTQIESDRALAMKRAGYRIDEIAHLLGCSTGSVRGRLNWLTMNEDARERRRQRVNEYRRDQRRAS